MRFRYGDAVFPIQFSVGEALRKESFLNIYGIGQQFSEIYGQ
jgi:hypothetical protein